MGLYQRGIEPSQILGNKMIYRLARLVALIGIGLGLQGASQAEGLLSAVGPQWNHSNDTDGLRIDKWAVTGFTSYQSGQQWRGIELQQQQYRKTAMPSTAKA